MSGDGQPGQAARRRQRRRPADTSSAERDVAAKGAPRVPAEAQLEPAPRAGKQNRTRRTRESGGLRDLAGTGPSYLGVGGAMRGRDVNRPTPEDLAEAERDLVIVRRNWKPDADHGAQQ